MVNEDLVNHISYEGVHFHGQEMVNEDSVNHILDGEVDLLGQEMVNEDAESSDSPQDGGVRRVRETGPPGRCTSL